MPYISKDPCAYDPVAFLKDTFGIPEEISGSILEELHKGEAQADIVESMMAGVTKELFERFRQAGPGNWFQMYADGRVTVGPLPERLRGLVGAGKFRAASTPAGKEEKAAPIIAIECTGFWKYEEFLNEIRTQLEEFY
jgi:hypothetical protein